MWRRVCFGDSEHIPATVAIAGKMLLPSESEKWAIASSTNFNGAGLSGAPQISLYLDACAWVPSALKSERVLVWFLVLNASAPPEAFLRLGGGLVICHLHKADHCQELAALGWSHALEESKCRLTPSSRRDRCFHSQNDCGGRKCVGGKIHATVNFVLTQFRESHPTR
jgi:hypothetical protein